MANVSLWSGVSIAVQSAIGAAQSISGITKASPGVVTYAGADPTNGDYILVTATGMNEVNNRVFRVANVNAGANTLELEGENTTSYGTFSAGNMYPLTFGTTLATLTTLSSSGGSFEFIDTTTIHDTVKTNIPGAAEPAVYTFESIWDVADTGLVALKAASQLKSQRAVRITFSNSQKVVFNGYIGATLLPVGNSQDKVTTQVVITMYGQPTVYST